MGTSKVQTIDSWLTTHAMHQPATAALNFGGETLSYAEFADWVGKIAAGLQQELGLRRGDRFTFYGHNSDVEVALMFAAAKLGLVMVPLNWRLAPAELNFIIGNCGAKVLFHGPEFDDQIPDVTKGLEVEVIRTIDKFRSMIEAMENYELVSKARLSDPLFIVYTSGTTGRPKGAVMTQEAILWNAVMSLHAHDFTPADHVLMVLPLFHVGGINIQMLPCFFVGGTVTLHPAFNLEAVVDALENGGVTVTVLVPTIMKALLAYPGWDALKLPDLRLVNTGSTDVPVEILEAVNSRGIPMVQVYGATETGPIATYQKAAEARQTQGSIGRPGAHTQVRLMREDGSDCEVGEPGEIWVKGPNNFSYYWNNAEATEAAIVDGWFRTGDVAFRDEGGLYWFADRVKHVVISGGENIYPAELERILNRLPGIVEAAVVGRKDPKWGEVPVAVVVCEDGGPGRDEILAAFQGQIARYKHPKDVVFVDQLPRNALGKVVAGDVRRQIETLPG